MWYLISKGTTYFKGDNDMKRMIKVLLCITLAVSLCGCMNRDISGNYTLITATSDSDDDDSIAVGLAILKMLGMSIDLKLYKDKTGKVMIMGQEIPLTYDGQTISFTEEGKKETMSYTYKEGTLTISSEKGSLVFEKQPDN